MRQPLPASPVPRLALRRGEAAAAIGVSEDFFRENIAPELRWTRPRDGRVQIVSVREIERFLDENARRWDDAA